MLCTDYTACSPLGPSHDLSNSHQHVRRPTLTANVLLTVLNKHTDFYCLPASSTSYAMGRCWLQVRPPRQNARSMLNPCALAWQLTATIRPCHDNITAHLCPVIMSAPAMHSSERSQLLVLACAPPGALPHHILATTALLTKLCFMRPCSWQLPRQGGWGMLHT